MSEKHETHSKVSLCGFLGGATAIDIAGVSCVDSGNTL